jgi:hypothetical protein
MRSGLSVKTTFIRRLQRLSHLLVTWRYTGGTGRGAGEGLQLVAIIWGVDNLSSFSSSPSSCLYYNVLATRTAAVAAEEGQDGARHRH